MADELVKEILSLVKTLGQQDISGLSSDTLSRLAVKLASYKASLGEYVTLAQLNARDAHAEYLHSRAVAYQKLRDEGKGSTDSGELKHLDSREFFLAWNKAQHNADVLSTLSRDCHDLIEAIQGRLINLHQEAKESIS